VAAAAPGHDLAVVKVKAPSGLVVRPGVPVIASVDVQIQNRGNHAEVLADAGVLGIRDEGCRARKADRTLGDPILADVYRK
jgi:hypothetical protein